MIMQVGLLNGEYFACDRAWVFLGRGVVGKVRGFGEDLCWEKDITGGEFALIVLGWLDSCRYPWVASTWIKFSPGFGDDSWVGLSNQTEL